ncbi:hypothetical protein [Streptomyces minutiscleroticus]|uniref:Uncharacterized protein n=1 Tax=Streptomyces minutiscleroticus TaxID=68238 RepID=A0A918NHC4_9ACTN|nr:hypothetical protein [Streptomyces minutiscleroticus]GGX73194.1 hypothetical protein GCM10010358_29600 [Streptomyces minutiscleroticus]
MDGRFDTRPGDEKEAPIYFRLLQERGDVPAEVRELAERTWRDVGRAMDFKRGRPI